MFMTQKMIIVATPHLMKHFNKKWMSDFRFIQQQPDFFDLVLLLPPPVAVCVSSTMTKRFRDILFDGLSPDVLLSLRFANIPVEQKIMKRIRLD